MEGGDGTSQQFVRSADPVGTVHPINGAGHDMSANGMLRIVGYVGTSPITSPPSILMRIGDEEIRIPLRDPALRLPELQDRRPRTAPARPERPREPTPDDAPAPESAPPAPPRPHVDLYL
jgi:hypothetical protein